MLNPKSKLPRTLQTNILRRWMSEEQIAEIVKEYRSNIRSGFSYDRSAWLEMKPKEQEIEVFKAYLEEPSVLVKDLAKKVGWAYEDFKMTAMKTAIRLVYRNPELRNKLLEAESKME